MTEEMERSAGGVHDLSRPEHLLVWAMRAIAVGREDCPIVVKTFRAACGAKGEEALRAYGVFVKYLAMTAGARLRVHLPGCPCVSRDEAAVVAVVSAAQRSLHDLDEAPLREGLRRVVGRRPEEPLMFVAQSVARLLDTGGLSLPDRIFTPGAASAERSAPPPRLLN